MMKTYLLLACPIPMDLDYCCCCIFRFVHVVNAKHANNLSHLWWPCRNALCFILFNRIDDCCMLLAHLKLLVRFVLNVWRVLVHSRQIHAHTTYTIVYLCQIFMAVSSLVVCAAHLLVFRIIEAHLIMAFLIGHAFPCASDLFWLMQNVRDLRL